MRIGIVSDIHANLPAFVRVLTRLEEAGATGKIRRLGDIVGYGPYPNECLELLRRYNHLCLPGNHEWGVLGRAELVIYTDDARFVIEWTQKQLTPDNRSYLEALPEVVAGSDLPFTLVHASPRDPIWEYLTEPEDAAACFNYFKTKYCLVGHTHLPLVFRAQAAGTASMASPEGGEVVRLGDERLILNPGSVGQPRNRDPRAHYAVYDTEEQTISFGRVDYPIVLVQARMRDLDFPRGLIARLEAGY